MARNDPGLAQLRARIAALERGGGEAAADVLTLGLPGLDAALPWGGLPCTGLHEIAAEDAVGYGAALGFATVWLGRLAALRRKPILWLATGEVPYPPGLAALGLPAERLLVVHPLRFAELAWAAEEALRCRDLAGVLAECRGLDAIAARRLSLAARTSAVPALLVNAGPPIGPALTRWRVAPRPGDGPPPLGVAGWRWQLALTRSRGRSPGEHGVIAAWPVAWDEAARRLCLATPATASPGAIDSNACGPSRVAAF
jgi:protein ImuA